MVFSAMFDSRLRICVEGHGWTRNGALCFKVTFVADKGEYLPWEEVWNPLLRGTWKFSLNYNAPQYHRFSSRSNEDPDRSSTSLFQVCRSFPQRGWGMGDPHLPSPTVPPNGAWVFHQYRGPQRMFSIVSPATTNANVKYSFPGTSIQLTPDQLSPEESVARSVPS